MSSEKQPQQWVEQPQPQMVPMQPMQPMQPPPTMEQYQLQLQQQQWAQQLQQQQWAQQQQQQWAEQQGGQLPQLAQPPTCCRNCQGPITYERDMVTLVLLIICCGICALFCLPKREAVCVQCGLKQGYALD